MLEFIETRDDVLAVTVSGRITDDDLTLMMERLNGAMARHETVHVFVETRALTGIEISSLHDYIADALPMFKKLHQFGRVAVVADQTWVRGATRLESAVLPGISYRVFDPQQRDEALTWVQEAPRA
jgi:hypothetical protein